MSGKVVTLTIVALTILLLLMWLLENHSDKVKAWLQGFRVASTSNNAIDSRLRGNDNGRWNSDEIQEVTVYANQWSQKIVVRHGNFAHIIPPRGGWVALLPEGGVAGQDDIVWQYGETPYLGNISAFQLRGTDGGIVRIWTEPRH